MTPKSRSSSPPRPTAATEFRVSEVRDLMWRPGLTVRGKELAGSVRQGMVLRNETGQQVRVLGLVSPSPADIKQGQVSVLLERTQPSPVQPGTMLTEVVAPA